MPPRASQPASTPVKRTPGRILDTALALFNEQGAGGVSTNHICAAMGISPGNLYYHFRNKEAIIRALFERYRQQFRAILALPAGRALTYEDKAGYFEAIFETMWQYRFLHRDLDYLMRGDEELRAPWRAFAREVVEAGRGIMAGLVASGIMMATDEQLDALMVNIWVVVTAWSGFMMMLSSGAEGAPLLSEAMFRRGLYQMVCLEEPYLAPEVRARLPELKRQYLGDSPSSPMSFFGQL